MSIKSQIINKINRMAIPNPDTDSNVAGYLSEIYFYDTVEKYAKANKASLYKQLGKNGLIESDDELRQHTEKVVAKSPHFVLLSKTTEPRKMFDKENFILKISKDFNIPKVKLMKLAEECVKESKTPLTKTVIESS